MRSWCITKPNILQQKQMRFTFPDNYTVWLDLVTDSGWSTFQNFHWQVKIVTVVKMMQSNMIHCASMMLAILVWMTENAVAVQKLDRQQECSDQVGCGFAVSTLGCGVALIAARSPKTCGTCPGEEAVCEDADSRCDLLFEHPEVTGVSKFSHNFAYVLI